MAFDVWTAISWFGFLFVIVYILPRMMYAQMVYKLEESALKLELLSLKSQKLIQNKCGSKKGDEEKIRKAVEFFVSMPSNLDPYGIVRKIDETIKQMEKRFDIIVSSLVSTREKEERQRINYGLRAGMSVHQIAKIVRHYVETVKKMKNLQMAMIIQMQLPMIEKIAKSEYKGTRAFLEGWPVGDSIGSLAAASMMNRAKPIAKEVVYDYMDIDGRKCFVLKAEGPGPRLGRVDDALQSIMKKHKIDKVITIDAGLKLEGEKTGSVAEGVGFAMGGIGQRELIENMLLPKRIPLDGVIIKVGLEEAIEPMTSETADAVPKVQEAVHEALKTIKRGKKVVIIGIGNSCGTPNTKEHVPKLVKEIKKRHEKIKAAEKPKKSWF